MTISVFPSAADIGSPPTGVGKVATEQNLQGILEAACAGQSFVLSGFGVTSPSGLNLDIAAGVAIVEGRMVTSDDVIATAITDDSWVYLKVVEDVDELAESASIEVVADTDRLDPVPAGRVVLAHVVNSGGNALVDDERRGGAGVTAGVYDGSGVENRFISTGVTPSLVIVTAPEEILAVSGITASPAKALLSNPNRRGAYFHPAGTNISRLTWLTESTTWDPPSLADGTGATITITVTGAAVGDPVLVDFTSLNAVTGAVYIRAFVDSTNTVRVRLNNASGSNQDLASGTVSVWVLSQSSFQIGGGIEWDLSTLGRLSPYIVAGGFRVSTHATIDKNLNKSGRRYSWIACY